MRRTISRSLFLLILVAVVFIPQNRPAQYPQLARNPEIESPATRLTWKHFNRVTSDLKFHDRFTIHRALTTAFQIWNADPHPPSSLNESTRSDLRAAFSAGVQDLDAAARKSALQFLIAIGARSPSSVRLVLICLVDEDPQVRDQAAKAANILFTAGKDDTEFVQAVLQVLKQYPIDPPLCAVATAYVSRMGKPGQSLATDLAITQLASAYTQATWFFQDRIVEYTSPTPVVPPQPSEAQANAMKHAAAIIPATVILPHPFQSEAMSINNALANGARAAHVKIVELMADDKTGELRMKLAEQIVKEPTRFNRNEIVIDLLDKEIELSPQVLKAMQLDVQILMPNFAKLLQQQKTPVTLATLHTLKTIGLEGEEIRTSLTPLLNSPNDNILYSAAELLGRQDILKRAIIPQLIEDLRSESPDQRSIAARQLDELKLEPEILTKALIRAVDRRDMAARTGLISAIESAYYTRSDSIEMLKRIAEQPNDPERNFARAALRELDLTRAQNDAK